MVAPLLPTAFPNPAARSLACRPRTSSRWLRSGVISRQTMAGVPSSCTSTVWTSAGVITTGTRRFTLARTTPLRYGGSPLTQGSPPQSFTPPSRLLPPMMQPDQGRGLALLKVTVHGIPDLAVQRLQAVCLRVNGGADGAG